MLPHARDALQNSVTIQETRVTVHMLFTSTKSEVEIKPTACSNENNHYFNYVESKISMGNDNIIYVARFSMVWTEQVMESKRCFFISTTHYS